MKSHNKTLFISLVLANLIVNTAQARDADESIIVTASRTAQIADQTLAPVIVITGDEIERSPANDAAGLLRFHAGLDIGRNGGPGQTASVFMRGTDSNHTLVMIDGIKINPGTIGGAALNNISTDIIERIEIVKGPRSTLYGSEAIGGVINIITRRASQGLATEFDISRSRYNSNHVAGAVHYKDNELRAGAVISRLTTDGFPTRTTATEDRGHDNTSINTYVGKRFPTADIELSHWQATGTTEYVDFFLTPIDQDFSNSSTVLKLETNPHDNWISTAKLSHITDKIDQNQSADFSHTTRNTLDWQNDIVLNERQLLSAGLYLSRENTEAASFGTGFDNNTDVNAVYIQDDIKHGAHHALLSARYTDHESFAGKATWNLEYGYHISDKTRFTAAAGSAFRAPDSTDRFGFGGNPNLTPETSRNLELGLRYTLTAQQNVSIDVFDNRIDDLIDFVDPDGFLGPLPGGNVNVDKARIRGLEADYRLGARSWGMQISAIIQDPKNRENGKQLARRAKRSLTTSAYYHKDRYRFTVDLLASAKRKDSDFSTSYNPGYSLVNAAIQADISNTLRVYGKVENLFDREYVLADGFNTPERSVYIGLKYNYRD